MADGPYRFQQPGAGQFYFQSQNQPQHHPNTNARHFLARNGTASPTGRLKFNAEAPSPSRSPPVNNQSPGHSSLAAMYAQNHQGQPVMMNGGQPHQRFGMPMPKFQRPAHHAHHAQQHPHPHVQTNHALAQQHTFTNPALTNAATQHFTQTHIQNGTTANAEEDIEEPMTEHWQQQLQLATESRQASDPHYYARAIAQQSKGIQITSSQNDENAEGRNRAAGVKESRSGWNSLDFGGQGLRAISNNLFHYTFLEKLYLNHNKLKTLPRGIGQLKSLTHLDVSSNGLSEVPAEIGMLTNLKKLLLFDNNLRTLPYELGYLYQLETLGIEGNPLTEVLKSRIMQEGTKSLVKYLREEMPGKFEIP